MAVYVQHLAGATFKISNETSSIEVEIPMLDDDPKSGLQPVEMLLGSVAACMMSSGMEFVRRNGGAIDGVRMTIDSETETRPIRVGSIQVKTEFDNNVTERIQGQFSRAAERCKVHNTITSGPNIVFTQ